MSKHEERCAVVLVLGTCGSMVATRIDLLNNAAGAFHDRIMSRRFRYSVF